MMWSYIISCWKMGSICCGNHLPGWILPRSYAPTTIAKNQQRLQESNLHYSARPKTKKRRATRPGKEFNTQLLERFQHPQQTEAGLKQMSSKSAFIYYNLRCKINQNREKVGG